jgi:hypothetical protein
VHVGVCGNSLVHRMGRAKLSERRAPQSISKTDLWWAMRGVGSREDSIRRETKTIGVNGDGQWSHRPLQRVARELFLIPKPLPKQQQQQQMCDSALPLRCSQLCGCKMQGTEGKCIHEHSPWGVVAAVARFMTFQADG